MLERPYYLVLKFVDKRNKKYPYLVTCALLDGGFYRIDSLEQYLYDGTGVSDEYVSSSAKTYRVTDDKWDLKELIAG